MWYLAPPKRDRLYELYSIYYIENVTSFIGFIAFPKHDGLIDHRPTFMVGRCGFINSSCKFLEIQPNKRLATVVLLVYPINS